MGILIIFYGKWVEFRRISIDHAGSYDRATDVSDRFWNGDTDLLTWEPYLNFLIPGVVSLTTMNGSFNAIA